MSFSDFVIYVALGLIILESIMMVYYLPQFIRMLNEYERIMKGEGTK